MSSDAFPEQLDILRNGVARIGSDRGLVWVEGRDAVGFLQGILSQDVEEMGEGTVAQSLFLGPQGKLEAVVWLLRGDQRVGILTQNHPAEFAGALDHYRIRVKAEIRIDDRPVSELWGPGSHHMVGLEGPGLWFEHDGGVVAALDYGDYHRAIVVGEMTLGEAPDVDGSAAVEAMRILIGEPLFGVDVDQKTIPQESGLLDQAVSLTKGCYLGQELVARIDSRGRVNRHLRVVELSEPVEPGTAVALEGKDVGVLTSTTALTDPPLGLGLLHRTAEPGSHLSTASGPSATVQR